MQTCYCCSGHPFETCCEPRLKGIKPAQNAEQLMRSRFSAYKTGNFQYILDTYGEEQKSHLSIAQLQDSARDTHWLGLNVVNFSEVNATTAYVEFRAFYIDSGTVYQMHEVSEFEYQKEFWKYTTGQIQADSSKIKVSRNDTCPCQSGKKFKHCCLSLIK